MMGVLPQTNRGFLDFGLILQKIAQTVPEIR